MTLSCCWRCAIAATGLSTLLPLERMRRVGWCDVGSRVKGRSSHVWVCCPACGKEVQRPEYMVEQGRFLACHTCKPDGGSCPESLWNDATGMWAFCQLEWSHEGRCYA